MKTVVAVSSERSTKKRIPDAFDSFDCLPEASDDTSPKWISNEQPSNAKHWNPLPPLLGVWDSDALTTAPSENQPWPVAVTWSTSGRLAADVFFTFSLHMLPARANVSHVLAVVYIIHVVCLPASTCPAWAEEKRGKAHVPTRWLPELVHQQHITWLQVKTLCLSWTSQKWTE